jgi:hypothetical protein
MRPSLWLEKPIEDRWDEKVSSMSFGVPARDDEQESSWKEGVDLR